jgi:hypothetical protein
VGLFVLVRCDHVADQHAPEAAFSLAFPLNNSRSNDAMLHRYIKLPPIVGVVLFFHGTTRKNETQCAKEKEKAIRRTDLFGIPRQQKIGGDNSWKSPDPTRTGNLPRVA